MGTRNLTAVMQDGEYKIAQYGQWDGYPGGQGVTILSFLQSINLEQFKEKVKTVRWITEDEWKDIIDNHTNGGSVISGSENEKYWNENLQHLSRDIAAGILRKVYDGEVKILKNSIGFAGDSLFCEYCYVIDLDKNTFEVFEGFNKEPIKEGRFISGDTSLERQNEDDREYEPVRLVKIYSLDSLPNEDDFINDFKEEDEE